MTLEATLERIAAALETLAENSQTNLVHFIAPTKTVEAALEAAEEQKQQPAPEGAKPPAKRASRAAKPEAEVVTPEAEVVTPEAEVVTPEAEVVTPEAEAVVEYKDVQAAATRYSQVGNRDGVLAIFAGFGIKTLKDLQEPQYAAIITEFNQAADAFHALEA